MCPKRSLRCALPSRPTARSLESTANGAGGSFYEEWHRASETGYQRHFYPWWWEPRYRRPLKITEFTDEEIKLMQKQYLDAAQIAFRREMRANFRNRAPEEYAEDPESCFLASGDCVFDAEIIRTRLLQRAPIIETVDHGRLLTFFPPVPAGKGYLAKQYIIGVDPAGGGTDGDYSCVQVIDKSSGMQCAELQGHYSINGLAAAEVTARAHV